ncbi:MAG TPA: ABC transporter permease [Dissulfurispiraceae bacterium]|nr:ABC transporter permease [Dissulfurispiraceae bacterium]
MKLLRIKAIAKKELIQIRRDPLSLAIAFLMPVMQLFIYGYAITFDVNNIKTVVLDRDRSSLSRELVSEFESSGYFTIAAYIDRYNDIDTFFKMNRAKVAIIIPERFSKEMKAGKSAQVGVILDGSDSNTATIAQGYIDAVGLLFAQRSGGAKLSPAVDMRGRVWYNPELKSRNFIIPGLIVVIMAVIVALLTSLTVAREWERGTMEQLISTPVSPAELIVGKLIPYFCIGLADILMAISVGVFWFGVPLKGSPLLLILLAMIFTFGGVSFGILISISAKGSQAIASQMALLSTFLPSFLLSGFMFAISNMPAVLQLVTYIFPARYFVTISKGIFLKGNSAEMLAWEALLLTLFGIAVFILAVRKFRKRMD